MPERLVIVANRLPLTLRRSGNGWHGDRSSGGLVAALAPVMARRGGIWLGWPGDAAAADEAGRSDVLTSWERDHGYVAVELPPAVSRAYYEGYANNTLWPTLHGFPTRAVIDPETWHAYRDANERFAAALADRHQPGDLVWVHDYQLMLVPELARGLLPDARIGFFLHVPFPGAEVFRILPERKALLRGLLGADLLGFQTHGHLLDFRRSLLEILGVRSDMNRVEWEGRQVALAAHPIGIVTADWERLATADKGVARRVRDLRSSNPERRLILAVDRLDYTKGIAERLRAFRQLLRRSPHLRGRIGLLQVAVPTRERIRSYVELRREVSELVGEINGEFGSPEWSPVVYIRRAIPRSELAALYVAADVAWVAPLRDGMNLVAKEFVACQVGREGALVLSEFAGAAQEMGEAIRVNPYDQDGSAIAVERALQLPAEERRERQAALLTRVRRNDALAWSERFLAALTAAARSRSGDASSALRRPPVAEVRAAAARADLRGLYLDYDGTLVPIAERPADAVPLPGVVQTLTALAAEPANRVVIVSGRPVTDVDRWFGGIPGLWLAAEHGGMLRDPTTGRWQLLRTGADTSWKARVRPILDEFADQAPGSFVEEKALGLAWHHRLAHPEFGPWLANELASVLERQLTGSDLVVTRGRKVVEVRFGWANKGEAVGTVRSIDGRPSFELAIGDDRTDEDLFERLPAAAWTIRVGDGPSRARYRLPDPAAVLVLLGILAEVPAGRSAVRRSSAPRGDGRSDGPRRDRGSRASGAGSSRRPRSRASS